MTIILVNLIFSIILGIAQCSQPSDQKFWINLAKNELNEALNLKWNTGTAKNIILFVGDGMGPNTITATRIYEGGETHRLLYEKFPHMGMLKTYSADKIVPDSACAATALFTGVKVNKDTVGVDASVARGDCKQSLLPEARLTSLAAMALRANKSAGFVTTMRVTHATPSPLYAHSADRRWECDANMPANASCKDIARQLVEDWPGRDFNVIMGGGRKSLTWNITGPPNPWECTRKDGLDLIETYKKDKQTRELKYSVVSNNKELLGIDVEDTDYLLGIFADSHMDYEYQRDKSPAGMPSISEMTEAAIKVLNKKNKDGFFLMVEGGNVDMAHHRGRAKVAIYETAAMVEAVRMAVSMTDEKDTLIIVTSDHTHTLNINGYPDRGSNIFGIAQASKHDGINYTTLAYTTGGPGSFQYSIKVDENNKSTIVRQNPSKVDTDDMNYEQIAGITLDENSHGGGDVTIYARGPFAHLFHNIHEQHYVYHVIMHAAEMDGKSQAWNIKSMFSIVVLSILLCTFL